MKSLKKPVVKTAYVTLKPFINLLFSGPFACRQGVFNVIGYYLIDKYLYGIYNINIGIINYKIKDPVKAGNR